MNSVAAGLAILGLCATPVAAESWHRYSHSANAVYMADVDSIAVDGEITSVRVATVPRSGPAGDYSHMIETFEFRCGRNSTWRTDGIVEYGPDGGELGRYPEDNAEWEEIHRNTLPAFLEQIVCDGSRADPPIWATIKDFVDAGRG